MCNVFLKIVFTNQRFAKIGDLGFLYKNYA